ncbi:MULTISPECIES: hypothetical protein [Enterobacterales]|uniref:Uncharacterized protein n=1 Tax=Yersinia enterocolitica TaxID=630 RepID=C0LEH3_YEREN|nr:MULTISPECIES: hypothetical protein [Enterobacterales]ACN58147.1 hypothetical protein [Yersinia enterocolitica]MDE9585988.1 hypothetical protein [Citrobacter braakii]
MSIREENEKHVDRVLNQISVRLESLTVSAPKLSDLSTLRENMLRLLGEASDLEITASGLRLRLDIENEQIRSLEYQLGNLQKLVEEGKACLRSGEPVRPECGMAPALLPEVQNELVAAQQVAAATRSELSACQHQIDLCNANVSRAAEEAYLSAHLAYVSTLLRESMDLAAMAGAKVNSGAATVTLDRRLGLLFQNQGMVMALKNYQGERR